MRAPEAGPLNALIERPSDALDGGRSPFRARTAELCESDIRRRLARFAGWRGPSGAAGSTSNCIRDRHIVEQHPMHSLALIVVASRGIRRTAPALRAVFVWNEWCGCVGPRPERRGPRPVRRARRRAHDSRGTAGPRTTWATTK